jgi:hypothetical protein
MFLKDLEGKRLNILGLMNVKNDLFYEKHEGIVDSQIVINWLSRTYCDKHGLLKKTS